MNQNTGEILTTEELQDRVSSATQEEQAAIRAAFETLTQGQYDKYSQLPQSERPAAKAFDDYLAKKRRVNEPRTQRQAFYAGYQAALANQPKSALEEKLEQLKEKAEEMEKIATDDLTKG